MSEHLLIIFLKTGEVSLQEGVVKRVVVQVLVFGAVIVFLLCWVLVFVGLLVAVLDLHLIKERDI